MTVPDGAPTSPFPSPDTELLPAESRPVSSRLALLALGIGGFGIGTGEFVIMGLLPDAASDLAISIPEAGHLISAYALGVVIGAPLLAVLGARWPRRNLLIALMAVFAAGNFASALAPSYGSMIVARLLTGFPHGTYFGVAALVAASLVAREKRAQAVGMVMLGLTIATLVGVPIAAAIGQWLGWRSAFALVGAIGLLAVVTVWRWVPFVPADRLASPLRELSAFRRKQVWLTLGIGAIGFGGMFAVFSYIKPTMIELAHLPASGIPFVLALFGVGMVAGNLAGAKLADKALMPTIGGLLVWSALVLGLFVFTAPHAWLASANVLLIGTVVALGPALQIRLMDVAGDAQTLAAALNHSAFNLANALGAWLGGVTIAAGLGWASTGWVGLLLALGGLLVFAVSVTTTRRQGAPAAA
ncbi:MFS transporter [Cupriavidus respiraculi]|uniref:Inner membrane transport protein YdhP n=1 Tax=Cupriavidus respiraculi TaxID=195930 RepID=A0ABM8WK97_9BURK|nr:MFS transporter [Cupriavidus respiraculi]MBY4948281.1 MFS transporter [Cupriavidus respiraculi]CAG9167796.1 Inner membrane transport protein YdhP [Cupriavidus respiraculi]